MAHIDAGQDDDDRAHPLLHRRTYKIGEVHEGAPAVMDWMEQEQERGHHDHLGPPPPPSGRTIGSTFIDTPGHVRLHGRGSDALAAGARRRESRCSTPSPASRPQSEDSLAPGRQVPRPPASPTSTRWTASARTSTWGVQTMIESPRARHPVPIQLADRLRGRLPRRDRPGDDESDRLQRRPRPSNRKERNRRSPRPLAEAAAAAREHLLEEVSHYDDGLLELVLEEAEVSPEALKAAIRQCHPVDQADAGAVRFLLQEQGACSRCSTAVIDYLPLAAGTSPRSWAPN